MTACRDVHNGTEEPAKLARRRAQRVAAVRIEPSRSALQAAKPAPESKPARPRVRDTGEGW
ncbi:MAG TPA: hypothetical protein VF601_18520 [Beijerinckiaceae bacterium]|jgi:hypothetical protein